MAAIAIAMTGCTPAPAPEPLPSPSPAFATDEEALLAAEDVLVEYFETTDLIYQEGGNGLERISHLVTGPWYDDEVAAAEVLRSHGIRQTGSVRPRNVSLIEHSFVDGTETITVSACIDYTEYGLVVGDGDAVELPGFEPTKARTYLLAVGTRVKLAEDNEGVRESC